MITRDIISGLRAGDIDDHSLRPRRLLLLTRGVDPLWRRAVVVIGSLHLGGN